MVGSLAGPTSLGSGMFGTPFARMQAAALSDLENSWSSCAGVTLEGSGPQVFWADWNAGALGSRSITR